MSEHTLELSGDVLSDLRPVVGPKITMSVGEENTTLDTPSQRIRFSRQSSQVVERVFPLANGSLRLSEISSQTGYSVKSIFLHLNELQEDDAIGWLGASVVAQTKDDYFTNLRKLAHFWNRTIFCEPTAERIFNGHAGQLDAKIWALEFYSFIRAANRYMANGISRLDIPSDLQEIGIRHYVEEAEHEEIFLEGLVASGFSEGEVVNHTPLPSTSALLNHLFEIASENYANYLALFTVMQPLKVHPSTDEITQKYADLASAYPSVAPFFSACKNHDLIDAGLGHSEWGLEELVSKTGLPCNKDRLAIEHVMAQTSAFFCLFYRGIGRRREGTAHRTVRHPVGSEAAFFNAEAMQ